MSLAAKLLLLVLAACLGAAGGYRMGQTPLQVELANLRTQHAETERLRSNAAARTLQAAQERGHALSTQLAQRQQTITALERKRHAALQPYLSGRPCLDAGAVGVLNDDTHSATSDLSKTASAPAATDARFATDTDVGSWISNTKAAYNDCTARLDALIDWATGEAAGQMGEKLK